MRTLLPATSFALFALVACGGGGAGSTDSTDSPSTGTPGGTGGGTGGGVPTSDSAFFATGSYNGTPFEAACDFDGADPSGGSTLFCFESYAVGYRATCRPENASGLGGAALFQVWFSLGDTPAPTDHDYLGSFDNGISIGDGYSMAMNGGAANAVSNHVVVDAIDPYVTLSGTFWAEWADQGGEYGDVTGTFDIVCP